MPRFQMRVITVEAERFDLHSTWPEGVKLAPSSITFRGLPAIRASMTIPVSPGDWIVTLPTGERFPVQDAAFRLMAEPDGVAGEMALSEEIEEIERPMVRTGAFGRLAAICPYCNQLVMSSVLSCEHLRRLRLADPDEVVELIASDSPDDLNLFAIFRDTPPGPR